ncbi:collagen-binding domain-containing protein [Promicromonospora sukumoe]|uniref:collagen-binding domain-containing protein n=1 Tax=Promicromonospora sukumoe TaxID=88382 RepID=UPI00365328C1
MISFRSGTGRGRVTAAAAAIGLTALVALTGLAGVAGVSGALPAHAAVSAYNPFDVNSDFTIVTTGDARLANAELEGSVAAFGSISSGDTNGYTVLHQTAGQADYSVPLVDGDPVRILAGQFTGTGSFDISNRDDSGTIGTSSPEANALAKLADTTGLTAQVRGGGVGDNAGGDFPRVTNADGGFLDLKAAPFAGFAVDDLGTEQDAVADYFPGLEADVARTNDCLASMYGNPALSNAVTVSDEGGLVYLSGFSTTMPNVVDYEDIAGATVKMDRADGYVPTAQAPLVIRVPEGTTSIGQIDIEGWSAGSGQQQDYARYIMLDLSAVTGTVTVDGLELGAIWAPNAVVEFSSGVTTNGQWFADGVSTSGGGEIHHHPFGGRLLCDDAVTAVPEIGSSVAVQGTDDTVLPVTGGTVIDTVTYSGLTPGVEYVATGTVVTADGASTGVTNSTTFTPTTPSGTVEVPLVFTAEQAAAYAGQSLVVFEELSRSAVQVATHEDLADEAQTFTVAEDVGPSPSPSPSVSPSTTPSPGPSPSGSPSASTPAPSGAPTPTPSGSPGAPGTPDDGPGSLAVTGSPAGVLGGLAAAAVVIGALLIAVRRRVGR